MKYQLSYDKQRDLINGKIEGEIDPDLVEKMASELAALVISTGCHKLLNDLRGAKITHSTLDIYQMPRIVDRHGVLKKCKRALLVSESSEDFEFLETVSLNVGQQVRVFKEPQAAIDWLK